MKANLGCVDRIVRAVLGAVFLSVGLMAGLAEPWNYVADGVGGVLLLTSMIKFCPAYTIFGASTCKTCEKNKK